MGNTFACRCTGESDDEVVVMKENGGIITFNKGATVQEVLVAHQGYRIVRCGSDPAVLPEHVELKTDRLYFLVPEKFAGCKPIYNQFLSTAESKGLLARPKAAAAPAAKKKEKDGDATTPWDSAKMNGPVTLGHLVMYEETKKSPWTPGLQTIPEVASPAKHEEMP